MNRIVLKILFIFFVFVSLSAHAQVLQIEGNIIDKYSGNEIRYVNVGIEGTLIGAASDSDGNFQLKVPAQYADKNIYFSAIAYQNLVIPLTRFVANKSVVIELVPLSYDIDDVEVTAKSKVLYSIVRNAVRNMDNNFVTKSFKSKALYSSKQFVNNVQADTRDVFLTFTDKSGYADKQTAFKHRNYRFANSQRNFDVHGFSNATTFVDDLLSMDILRSTMNVTDTLFLDHFSLTLIDEKNDSVWAIAFAHNNPDFLCSGDYYVQAYSGVLYISKNNNLLVQAHTKIQAKYRSRHGRNVAVKPENAYRNVEYISIVSYRNSALGYVPHKISLDMNYKNLQSQSERILASLTFFDFTENRGEQITSRQYYENILSDPDFWKQINLNE